MANRVLLVDDEANVLQGCARMLRGRVALAVALGGHEALALMSGAEPFAVVVSDMRMPDLDGVEFLSRVKLKYPDTVRIMLTGNADQATAVEAVNRGEIFRFLCKPCEAGVLVQALEAGIRQYQLVTAERQLLEQTLKGALAMLVELLGLLDPVSFGRAQAMAALAEATARELDLAEPWVLGIAATLSQIGILTVPAPLVAKLRTGRFLSGGEREIANRVPEIGSNLLRHIPRLEQVAEAILYMNKNFNGTGFPADGLRATGIPVGGRILRVVSDYLDLLGGKGGPRPALAEMQLRPAWYDLAVVAALARVLARTPPLDEAARIREVPVAELRPGQCLEEDLRTAAGLLLVPAGTRLGRSHLENLRNVSRISEIHEPIRVVDGED